MWAVARRPRWIAALLLALGLAAGFAALGQWQLGRAVQTATVVRYPTEKVVPLDTMATPQSGVTTRSSGQLVSVDASRMAGDNVIVSGRDNHGPIGYWVIAHYVDSSGTSLAVALGWASTQAKADAAASGLDSAEAATTIVGRYQPTEPPDQQDFEKGEQSAVSIPAFINEWSAPVTQVYGGYVVAENAPAGLTKIYSPRPIDQVSLDWLNVFYAIEWTVFAAAALYLWYRVVKDAWEKEEYENLTQVVHVN